MFFHFECQQIFHSIAPTIDDLMSLSNVSINKRSKNVPEAILIIRYLDSKTVQQSFLKMPLQPLIPLESASKALKQLIDVATEAQQFTILNLESQLFT